MKLKLIAIIAFLAIGVLALFSAIKNDAGTASEYKNYIKTAEANAEKDIPYIAVSNYKKAFDIKTPDEETYAKYLAQTKKLGEDFYSDAVEDYITVCPESSKAYETLCNYYKASGSTEKLINCALEAKDKGIATENVRQMYLNAFYSYKLVKGGLEEANSFLGSYARIKLDGKYGFIKENGSYLLSNVFDEASFIMSGSTAVKDSNGWYMINTEGYKVAVPSRYIKEMAMLSNNLILVRCTVSDGKKSDSKAIDWAAEEKAESKDTVYKYDFMTSSMNVPDEPRFDYATNFKNGVAAVKKDGKWALLGSDNKFIKKYIFDDVIIDEFNTCINNGVIFAKSEGKYYMYDAEGKKISKTGFDNARPFVSDGYAAVCVNGKWGFVNSEGETVITPMYEDAQSFCCGLAPVKVDGKWGYISTEAEKDDKGNVTGYVMRIEAQYDDCRPFASSGIAAVKEGETWEYIKLNGYDS